MKKLHFLTKNLTLIFVLALCTVQLSAQDKITLTWQIDYYKHGGICCQATFGESFTINWGDGEIETFISNEGSNHWKEHMYASEGEYEVTILALTNNCRFYVFIVNPDNKASKLNFFECSALTEISCIKNQLTNLDLSGCTALTELNCYYNQITNLNLSGCSSLIEVNCYGNQITNLNLSGCNALERLYCDANKITNLDLSDCTNLKRLTCSINNLTHLDLSHCPTIEYLKCNDNQLQLSDLYALHLFINGANSKILGAQNLPPTWTNIDTELFADQAVFEGVFTQYYQILMDGLLAPEDSYSITEGKLTFHSTGKYIVFMTNEAIISHPDYPVEVIVKIDVSNVGVKENESLNIEVYPNPTKGELRVTSYELQVTSIEVFDIFGKKLTPHTSYLAPQTSLDISDLAAGVYFVKIYTELGVVTKKIIKN